MRMPFCILSVRGDVLDNGELHFKESARSLEAARRRIQALAELSPGEYVIYNKETGERLLINARDEALKRQGEMAASCGTNLRNRLEHALDTLH
jgi:hypothetical protein